MTTFLELYQRLADNRTYENLITTPLAQFGSERIPMLGARLLPEVIRQENVFKEERIRFRSLPALDGTAYSPTQMQDTGGVIGSLAVELGHTDTRHSLSGKDLDDIMRLLDREADPQATAQAIRWMDKNLVQPHLIKNEIQRWQALLLAEVRRYSTDGNELPPAQYYRNAATHLIDIPGGTVATPDGWHRADYPIINDISLAANTLNDLGYDVTGLYCTGRVMRLMKDNTTLTDRDRLKVNNAGAVEIENRRGTNSQVNQRLNDDELPELTIYNGGFEQEAANNTVPAPKRRYLDVEPGVADYLLVAGSTQRDWDMAVDYTGQIDVLPEGYDPQAHDDLELTMQNTLGYYAIGRNTGQASPGRTVTTELKQMKPRGIEGESYQTGLPVITEPDAYIAIRIRRPT